MKIKVSADSTCDLSPELIERYGIGITPLYIVRGEETLDFNVVLQAATSR